MYLRMNEAVKVPTINTAAFAISYYRVAYEVFHGFDINLQSLVY